MNEKFVKTQHCFITWVFHHLGFGDKSIAKINQAFGDDDKELKSFGDFVWQFCLEDCFV